MNAGGIVLLAVASGELATVADTDAVLRDLSLSHHHDQTWQELIDALLDQRNLVLTQTGKEKTPVISLLVRA